MEILLMSQFGKHVKALKAINIIIIKMKVL